VPQSLLYIPRVSASIQAMVRYYTVAELLPQPLERPWQSACGITRGANPSGMPAGLGLQSAQEASLIQCLFDTLVQVVIVTSTQLLTCGAMHHELQHSEVRPHAA
jgi:hypothetical protein